MDMQFLEETKMLNFKSIGIQKLINENQWRELTDYDKIKEVYNYVQNEILFGYNCNDTLTAEQVLLEGYGQCNTKATLLMALLRGVGIPCRIHGFEVEKSFQRGTMTGIVAAFAPPRIVHTWAEVYYNGEWFALEGVITDNHYIRAIKTRYSNVQGEFMQFAIATKDFQNLNLEWKENSTYVQSAAIVADLGIFTNPDIFFIRYPQHWGKIKSFMYAHFGRKMMNYKVNKIRKIYNE